MDSTINNQSNVNLEYEKKAAQIGGLDNYYELDRICNEIREKLGSEFVAIQWILEEDKIIESLYGVSWVGLSRHYLEEESDLRDIQADIVKRFQTEIIAGKDDRFDRGIFENQQFDHKSMVRIFTPILLSIEEINNPELNNSQLFKNNSDIEIIIDKNEINPEWFKNPQSADKGQHTIIKIKNNGEFIDKMSSLKAIGTIELGYKNPKEEIKPETAIELIKYIDKKANTFSDLFAKLKSIYPSSRDSYGGDKKRNDLLEVFKNNLKTTTDDIYQIFGSLILNILAAQIVTIHTYNDTENPEEFSLTLQTIAGKHKKRYEKNEEEDINIFKEIIKNNKNIYDSKIDLNSKLNNISLIKSEGINSGAAILLKEKENSNKPTVGIICIYYRRNHEFCESEKKFIERLVNSAISLIEEKKNKKILSGTVVKIIPRGYGYISSNDNNYFFSFRVIKNYHGETAKELKLHKGSKVEFKVKNEIITELSILS